MQGETYIPYTGIGGQNMDSGIMPADLSGSTQPGIIEDEDGTTVNVVWTFPGGINNKQPGGYGWGYAVLKGKSCTDDDIKKWLTGEIRSDRSGVTTPSIVFTEEEIAAEDPRIVLEINNLIQRYANDVLMHGDYNEFRANYTGCVLIGK